MSALWAASSAWFRATHHHPRHTDSPDRGPTYDAGEEFDADTQTVSRRNWRQRLKHAVLGNLPSGISSRQRLSLILQSSPLGQFWDLVQTVISIVSCVLYVAATYDLPIPDGFDLAFTLLFTVDYFVRWYASSSWCRYPFQFFAIIDVLTCAPVYIELVLFDLGDGVSFLRFVRVLRIMRILRAFKVLNNSMGPVSRQALVLALTVVSMIFLFAGLINLVETQLDTNINGGERSNDIGFGDALYMAVVTMSTVGYGDIHPITPLGMAVTALFIIMAIVIIPMQVNKMTDAISLQSRFRAPYVPDPANPHVLVVGHVSDPQMLRDLLNEIYHPDRLQEKDERFSSRTTVIMGPDEPTEGVRALMISPLFDGRVRYLRGSVMSAADLHRAAAQSAEACFVLSNPGAVNPGLEDKATALRVVTLHKFAKEMKIFVHMLQTDTLHGMGAAAPIHEAVCAEEWRMRLVAQTCLIPGFSTLVTNLLRAGTVPADDNMKPWLAEYTNGNSMELYPVTVPRCFDGMAYTDVVQVVQETFGGFICVWGVRELDVSYGSTHATARMAAMSRRHAAGALLLSALASDAYKGMRMGLQRSVVRGAVLLNPGPQYRVMAGQVLYVVAREGSEAEQVSLDSSYTSFSGLGPKRTRAAAPNNKLPAPLPPGNRINGPVPGYGFPDDYAEQTWTWAGNSERENIGFRGWFEEARTSAATATNSAENSDTEAPRKVDPNVVKLLQTALASAVPATGGKPAGESGAAAAVPASAPTAAPATGPGSASAPTAAAGKSRFLALRGLVGAATGVTAPDTAASSTSNASAAVPSAPAATAAKEEVEGEEAGGRPSRSGSSAWSRLRTRMQKTMEARNESPGAAALATMRRARRRRNSLAAALSPALVAPRDVAAERSPASREKKKAGKELFASFASVAQASVARGTALRQLVVQSVEDSASADAAGGGGGHIIVCCSLRSFAGFLVSLRDSHLVGTSLHRPIVLLTSYDDDASAQKAIEDIAFFGGVNVVIGSIASPKDLQRAGIKDAACLVLLPDREEMVNIDGEHLDSNIIFSYLILEQALLSVPTRPSFSVIVELSSTNSMHVLNRKRVAKTQAAEFAAQVEREAKRAMLHVMGGARAKGSHNASLSLRSPAAASSNAVSTPVHSPGTPVRTPHAHVTASTPTATDTGYSSGDGTRSSDGAASAQRRSCWRSFWARLGCGRSSASKRSRERRKRRALLSASGSGALPPTTPVVGSRRHLEACNGDSDTAEAAAVIELAKLKAARRRLRAVEIAKQARNTGLGSGFDLNADSSSALPIFAAGFAYPTDSLHTLLVAAYFNREVLRFAEELLAPHPGLGSRLLAEPVPRRFHEKTFRDLCADMLSRYNVVVVGLYRCRQAMHSPLPYVYMNPHPLTPLCSCDDGEDLMYVLSPQPLFCGPHALRSAELEGMEAYYNRVGAPPPRSPAPSMARRSSLYTGIFALPLSQSGADVPAAYRDSMTLSRSGGPADNSVASPGAGTGLPPALAAAERRTGPAATASRTTTASAVSLALPISLAEIAGIDTGSVDSSSELPGEETQAGAGKE